MCVVMLAWPNPHKYRMEGSIVMIIAVKFWTSIDPCFKDDIYINNPEQPILTW